MKSRFIILATALLSMWVLACRPFHDTEVLIDVNEEVTLAGTLSIPDGEGPFPAVILISGSGPQTRDSDLWGFKVFKATAKQLAARGVVVLRCDDRGVGGSTGSVGADKHTTLDAVEDVLAQVAYLERRPEVDSLRIGLLGPSEGALVASMADARSDDIEFTILVAAPAVPIRQVLLGHLKANLELDGVDELTVAWALRLWEALYDSAARGDSLLPLRDELRRYLRARVERHPPRISRHPAWDLDSYVENKTDKELRVLSSKWLKFLLNYDPATDQARMDSRVLALYGGKDVQVDGPVNAAALEETFRSAGLGNYEIKLLQDANHLFQAAVTGATSEYSELPRAFVPGYLESISAWILGPPTS